MTQAIPKLPPMFVIDAAKKVHRAMTAAQRRMAPPAATLVELASSVWKPYALGLMAHLGIADLLAAGPRDVSALARETGTHEPSLYRVLRALAQDGILAQPAPRQFALTPVSEPLRSDHPQSVRNTIRQTMSPWNLATWARFHDAVTTGEPQFEKVHGKDLWGYFEDHPDHGAWFHASMAEMTQLTAPLLAAVYDFGQHRTLCDVGGGRATLLSRLLAMFPTLRGVSYDLAEAVKEAPRVLAEAGVSDRCEVVTGSFFDGVPAGHDAYLLKHIVHGLKDDALGVLFARLRDALAEGATLLLVEMLMPEGDGVAPSFLDLQMMVGPGGRERTESEYGALLSQHGFTLQRVHRTPSPTALFVAERRAGAS